MSILETFENYRAWFSDVYLIQLAEQEEEEVADLEWSDALGGLEPLAASELASLEGHGGALPQAYRELVLALGVGTLLITDEEEPVEFTLFHPKEMAQARKDCLGCVHSNALQRAKSREGIDPAKLVPILTDRDWNQWAMLANRTPGDDAVVLFSHEQEQRDDLQVFVHRGTVEDYFKRLFEDARALRSPWSLWTR
ncbi:MAG: hypothetical protein KUG77_14515 [Nannocystaceae bacterium]|nr:hypothetical protein [Nannocystaceae bacterium]